MHLRNRTASRRKVSLSCLFKLEWLESRKSLDGSGWTTIVPTGHTIYASSSTGSDSNDGLSPASAVQTLAKGRSLVRNGFGDALLLKRGDTFNTGLGFWTT